MADPVQTFLVISSAPAVDALIDERRPAFVFDRTGTRLLFANAAGFAFLGGDAASLLTRTLPTGGPLARRLSLAAGQLSGDRVRNDRLPLPRGLMPAPVLCSVTRVTAGNDRGVAVVVLEPVSGTIPSGTPREAFEAIVAGLRGPADLPAPEREPAAAPGSPIPGSDVLAPDLPGPDVLGSDVLFPDVPAPDFAAMDDVADAAAPGPVEPADAAGPVQPAETVFAPEGEPAHDAASEERLPEMQAGLEVAETAADGTVEAPALEMIEEETVFVEERVSETFVAPPAVEASVEGEGTAPGFGGTSGPEADLSETVSPDGMEPGPISLNGDEPAKAESPVDAGPMPDDQDPATAPDEAAAEPARAALEPSPSSSEPFEPAGQPAETGTLPSEPTPGAAPEGPAAPSFTLTTSGRSVRFVFELDRDAAFRFISGELAETLGAAVAPATGETWEALAGRLALDPLGRIGSALSRRDTFTGLTVAWPVEANALRVPVDLAGMPVFGRDRSFGGYRGFGIARTSAAYEDETALPAASSAPLSDRSATEEVGPAVEGPFEVEPVGTGAAGISAADVSAMDEPVAGDTAPDSADAARAGEGTPDAATTFEQEAPDVAALVDADPEERIASETAAEEIESPVPSDTADVALYASPPAPAGDDASPTDLVEAPGTPYGDDGEDVGLAGPDPESAVEAEAGETFVPINDVTWVEPVLPLENPTLEGSEAVPEGDLVWEDRPAAPVATESGPETEALDTAPSAASPGAEHDAGPSDSEAWAEEPVAAPSDPEGPAAEPVDVDEPVDVVADIAAAPDAGPQREPDDRSAALADGQAEDADLPPEAEDLATAEAPAIVADDEPITVHDEDVPPALLDPQSIEDAEARLYGLTPEDEAGEADAEAPVARTADGDEPFAASADEAARALYGDLGDTAGSAEARPLAPDEAVAPDDQPVPDDDALRPSADIIQSPVVARPIPPSPPPSEEDLNRRQLSRPERDAFQKIAEALGARVDESVFANVRGPENHDVIRIAPAATAPAPRPDMIDASVLDRLPVPLAVLKNGDAVLVNRAFLDLAGYESADALEEAGGFAEAFAGSPVAREQPLPAIRRADGSVVPVTARLHSVPFNEGMASLIVVQPPAQSLARFEPTTEESGRVRELEAMLDTATDGVLVIDDRGTIVAANRSAEALFGAERAAMNGVPLTELLAPESHRSALDYLDGLSRNGVASVLNDGREVIGRVRKGGLVPLFMTMGRVSPGRFCAVLRDITQWKRAEEELTAAKRSAETASSQKSDFLAKISHEIRTPLNAIIGFSEVMMEERFGPVGSERYKEYLRDIHMSGALIMSLVNDLLDLSKIEAGKLDLSFEAVSLNDVLRECVALMQPQANRDRVIIRTSLSSTVPNVVADPRSLRQIVLNLLSNAIKYNMAGGQVIVSTIYEETGEVAIRVRDTGPGMSADDLERALEPFRQLQTTQPVRGTGLGLPLTKALVEANRASFRIDSTVGQGTLVQITFPSTRVLAE